VGGVSCIDKLDVLGRSNRSGILGDMAQDPVPGAVNKPP